MSSCKYGHVLGANVMLCSVQYGHVLSYPVPFGHVLPCSVQYGHVLPCLPCHVLPGPLSVQAAVTICVSHKMLCLGMLRSHGAMLTTAHRLNWELCLL